MYKKLIIIIIAYYLKNTMKKLKIVKKIPHKIFFIFYYI